MAIFIPESQPTNVTPSGIIVAIPIPADYRSQRVSRVLVTHVSGSLTLFTIEASTAPLLDNPNMRIMSVVNAHNKDTVDSTNDGKGYVWDGEDRINWSASSKNIYVQIIPDAGSDNSFVIGLYIEKK